MEEMQIRNVLLRKAKEATYTNLEVERLNYLIDDLIIKYFLDRETNNFLSRVEVKEETLKEIYDKNKENYKVEERFKLETIFMTDIEKAKEVLKEVSVKNFAELKKKHDAKEVQEELEFITLSNLQPAIAELVVKNSDYGVLKELAVVGNGAHIIFFKEKEESRQATYEEAKNVIIQEIRNTIYNQAYNQIINEILNENVVLEQKVEEKQEEAKTEVKKEEAKKEEKKDKKDKK